MNIRLSALQVFVLIISVVADDPSKFIIGGQDAELGQFPHMVSIRMKPNLTHGCGGGILNRRWVLTVRNKGRNISKFYTVFYQAAHCLILGYQSHIVAGSVRLQDEGERYNIALSIPHPQYEFSRSNWHE